MLALCRSDPLTPPPSRPEGLIQHIQYFIAAPGAQRMNLTRKELKAIGAAIGWMADCLKQLADEIGQEAWDREQEKLRAAKAAYRRLNADYKASRPNAALGVSADDFPLP